MTTNQQLSIAHPAAQRGSVLVVVLWIVFGLVAITIYFASSMTYELRASDNRTAGVEAEQAIEAARRYLTCVLSNLNQPGLIPDPQSYVREAVPVGNAKFWIIGRTNAENVTLTKPVCALVDEASKLPLNGTWVTTNFAMLPRMTLDLAYNIMNWRTSNASTVGGADATTYMMQQPPYVMKGAPYETVDELRLVYNMNLDLLYGEDANMNGVLDANENDGDVLPPSDNMDGRLEPGLLEYLTVYTHEPTTNADGSARINLSTAGFATQLQTMLTTNFGSDRATQIMATAGLGFGGGPYDPGAGFGNFGVGVGNNGFGNNNGTGANTTTFASPLQFYMASGMTPAEFATIEASIMGASVQGLVNVNTASATVLSCLPGMDIGTANQLVTFRQSNMGNQENQNSVSWVAQVLPQMVPYIGPYITGRTWQFTADIAAVGHEGRGFRRVKFVFDTGGGTPIIVHRQDISHLGWPLGKPDRNEKLLTSR